MKTKTVITSIIAATVLTVASVPSMTAFAAPLNAGKIQLNGSGATFPQPLYEEWAFTFNKTVDPNTTINYSGVGSGQGKKDILNGTVDFAGSDAALTESEAKQKELIQVPTVAGAVVMIYNLPGVKNLILDGPTIAGIYLGKIEKWNDAAIAKLNPGLSLPNTSILVVHRADGSGTTNIFTSYLTVASETWRDTVKPPLGTAVDWPADKLKRGVGGRANSGVAAAVKQAKGAIGYVELAYAINNKMDYARMININGKLVSATVESTVAAMRKAWFDKRLASYIVNSHEDDAWPIAGFTYLIFPRNWTNCEKAGKVVQFYVWGSTSPEAKAIAAKQNYAPLPETIIPSIGAKLKLITCNGSVLFP